MNHYKTYYLDNYTLIVNRLYGIICLFLLVIFIILFIFTTNHANHIESELEEIHSLNENYLTQIEILVNENQILSTQLYNLTLTLENNLITQANLTINEPFQNNEIQIAGKSYSVVTGSIINFGLRDANNVEVEITWWVLNDCGCDAIPIRTESINVSNIPSSSVYYFDETFPFTFEKFEFLVINLDWK